MFTIQYIDNFGRHEIKPSSTKDGYKTYDFEHTWYDNLVVKHIDDSVDDKTILRLINMNCGKLIIDHKDPISIDIINIKKIDYLLTNTQLVVSDEDQQKIKYIIGKHIFPKPINYLEYNPSQGDFILFEGNLISLKYEIIITKDFDMLLGLSDSVRDRLIQLISTSMAIYL